MGTLVSVNEITERIIACAINVHHTLGPGFLETIYRRSLLVELRHNHLSVEPEWEVPIHYRDHQVGKHRLDLLVNAMIVVEVKTVETLSKAHYAQVRSYLKAGKLEVGLLINFACETLDVRRVLITKPRRIYEV